VDSSTLRRKVDEIPIESPPAEMAEQPWAIAAAVLRDAMAANNAEVNLLDEPEPAAGEEDVAVNQVSDDAIDALISGWERGSWFDLWTGEETERVSAPVGQPAWALLSLYVGRGRAGSLPAPSVLRGYVRAGRIRPAEKVPAVPAGRRPPAARSARRGRRTPGLAADALAESSCGASAEDQRCHPVRRGRDALPPLRHGVDPGGHAGVAAVRARARLQQEMMAPGLFLPEPRRHRATGPGSGRPSRSSATATCRAPTSWLSNSART